MTATLVSRAGDAGVVQEDAVWRNIKRDIDNWAVSWMQANSLDPSVYGILEEYGWPNAGTDLAPWQAQGEGFLRYVDTLGMPRCSWGAGRFWRTYLLGCWVNPSANADLNTAQPNALIYEPHLGQSRSGACVSGGEKTGGGSAGDPAGGGKYSTANLGVYGTDYQYPSAGDFTFLRSRGVKLARVMIKHERMQHTLGGVLDATEVGRLLAVLDNARAAGVKVTFCPWNGSRYRLGSDINTYEQDLWSLLTSRSTDSFGNILGVYTPALFADFWLKMATALQHHPALHGYSLANEPGEADEFGPPTGSNLVTVGDMEAGSGWTSTASALTYDTSNQRSGSQCAKLVADGTGLPTLTLATAFAVTPNAEYQLSAWVKAPAKVEQWTAQVNWLTSGGSYISSSTANFPLTVAGSYVGIAGGMTAPSTAGKASVKVHPVPSTDTAGTVFYIDDVALFANVYNTGGKVVEQFTQAAVTAIRTVDTTHEIWVAGFGNGPLHWKDIHAVPWITDPNSNFRYSIHYYFDVLDHNAGVYTSTYAQELANSIAAGF